MDVHDIHQALTPSAGGADGAWADAIVIFNPRDEGSSFNLPRPRRRVMELDTAALPAEARAVEGNSVEIGPRALMVFR